MSYGIPEIKADVRAAYDAGKLLAQCPRDEGPRYFSTCPETGDETCCAAGAIYRPPHGIVTAEERDHRHNYQAVMNSRGLLAHGNIDVIDQFMTHLMSSHDHWFFNERSAKFYEASDTVLPRDHYLAAAKRGKQEFLAVIDHPEALVTA